MFYLNFKSTKVKWLIRIITTTLVITFPISLKLSDPDTYHSWPIWKAVILGGAYGFIVNFGLFLITYNI